MIWIRVVAIAFLIQVVWGETTTTEAPVADALSPEEAEDLSARAHASVSSATSQEAAAADAILSDTDDSSSPFAGVQSILSSSPDVAELSLTAKYLLEALKLFQLDEQLSKKEMENLLQGRKIPKIIARSLKRVIPDKERLKRIKPNKDIVPPCPFPDDDGVNDCDSKAPYRTFDGTCNNPRFALYGAANTPAIRYLPPDYADGIQEARVAASGNPLPSARAVSLAIHAGSSAPSNVLTLATMTFAQFTDHDVTRTAISKILTDEGDLVNIKCGDDGCQTDGPENVECLPIEIPANDTVFGSKNCLMFVRSAPVPESDCKMSPRQHVNQVTVFVDGSQIYGSDLELANELRNLSDPARGRMLTTTHPNAPNSKHMLPYFHDEECIDVTDDIQCFHAGDERVNEQPALTTMHTIFVREHNRMEEILHGLHPEWDGETLYQETRRIMGAILQVIVYGEFLPILLGPHIMDQYDLTLKERGYFSGFKKRVNPSAANVFGGAAFRVGHSLVADFETYCNTNYQNGEDIPLEELFFRPHRHYQTDTPAGLGMDSLMLGQMSQKAESVDRTMPNPLLNHLFADPPSDPGHDLASLNIQRGRDQGLPGYPQWRKWCDLSVPKTFDEMEDIDPETRAKFAALYESVDDVDIFSAGLAETNLFLANVGPTFACIIATQFQSIKFGDIFWHENRDRNKGFSRPELDEIRKASLARIICDNLDEVETVQKRVMLRPKSEVASGFHENIFHYGEDSNERLPCADIPSLDLSVF